VETLESAGATAVERAPAAVHGLDALGDCADAEALLAPARPPATARAEVRRLRAAMAEVAALAALGHVAEARPRARQLATAAAALRQRPVEAEALQLLGRVEDEAGDAVAARTALERAVWAAEAGRDDARAARAWIALIEIVGRSRAGVDEALTLAPRVTALLERLGSGHEALAGALHVAVGRLQLTRGRPAVAAAELRDGMALLERHFGADDLQVAAAAEALGRAREAQQPGSGRDAFARVLAIVRKVHGDDAHPAVVRARAAWGAVDHSQASND
jgi:hypothetical protein